MMQVIIGNQTDESLIEIAGGLLGTSLNQFLRTKMNSGKRNENYDDNQKF